MKKFIILFFVLAFVGDNLQAQSFMDKMKSEKSTNQNSTTPSNQSTNTTPNQNTVPSKNVYQALPSRNVEPNRSIDPAANYPDAVDMYFRYTDQVQEFGKSLNLKVGDRIKVLEGQTISESFLNKKLDEYNGKVYYGKTGLSFDPNNPKICGKIFTVASTSPLKFTEEFPENMRNGFNSSFKFKVIKL